MHSKISICFTFFVVTSFLFIADYGLVMASGLNETATGEEINTVGVTSTLILLLVAGALAFSVYKKKQNNK